MDWPQWVILCWLLFAIIYRLFKNITEAQFYATIIIYTIFVWVLWMGGFFS